MRQRPTRPEFFGASKIQDFTSSAPQNYDVAGAERDFLEVKTFRQYAPARTRSEIWSASDRSQSRFAPGKRRPDFEAGGYGENELGAARHMPEP